MQSERIKKPATCDYTADYDPPRILVVVVSAATAVATTVQKFIVVVYPVTIVYYDCTETYRRSLAGNAS